MLDNCKKQLSVPLNNNWKYLIINTTYSFDFRSETSNIRKMCHRAQQINVTDPLNVTAGQSSGKAYTKDDARGFKEIFPDIVRELTFDGPYKDVPEVNTHIAKVIWFDTNNSN